MDGHGLTIEWRSSEFNLHLSIVVGDQRVRQHGVGEEGKAAQAGQPEEARTSSTMVLGVVKCRRCLLSCTCAVRSHVRL